MLGNELAEAGEMGFGEFVLAFVDEHPRSIRLSLLYASVNLSIHICIIISGRWAP